MLSACATGEYECYNSNCIPSEYVDDGINDCVDNSDEGNMRYDDTRILAQFMPMLFLYYLTNNTILTSGDCE